MLRGKVAMPACAEAQLPASIASNTPRQSLGTTTVFAGGATWVTTIGCCGAEGSGEGAEPEGCGGADNGASGSGEACAYKGAAEIKAPNASSPDFKTRPPSAATSPSMPVTCLRVD